MPLYDYKCKKCGLEFENFACINDRNRVQCKCGGKAELLITAKKTKDWFYPHWNEHFGNTPIYVRSRNHLRQLCKEHGVTSRAL